MLILAGSRAARSRSIASLPNKDNESRNQAGHDKHPVLAFETQNREMVDEKMHGFRPTFVQGKRFCGKNILFLYFCRADPARSRPAWLRQGMLSN
jgi:hypothetical protein